MRRISAIIVLVIFIISAFMPGTVNAEEVTKSTAAIEFISQLGIIEKDAGKIGDGVQRAEFVDMVIRSMDKNISIENELPFKDITASNIYFSSVSKAYSFGIISGSGDGCFNPDLPITLSAAIKITTMALGYRDMAQAYGGYPVGFMAVAKSINLIKGVTAKDSEALTLGECAILIYNFLNADLCKVTGAEGEYGVMERCEGENLLTEVFGLCSVKGIIKTAGYMSMIPDAEVNENCINIDGQNYGTEIENAEKYLGMSAVCWYDENREVKAIYTLEKNKFVEFDAENVSSADSTGILVYNEDYSEKKYPFEGVTFVKNGRYKTPDNSDFIRENGTFVLIDNDGDGKSEVVILREYNYMVVNGVNTEKGEVYARGGGIEPLVMKNKDGYHYKLTIADKDGTYSQGKISALSKGSVLRYSVSESGKYVEAETSTEQLNGIITEIYEKNVIIDGVEYKTNEYFRNNYNILPGIEGVFLLASDKTVTAISISDENKMSYGYLAGCYKKIGGITGRYEVALLTATGQILYTEISSNVMIDEEIMPGTDRRVESFLFNEYNIPKYQVVRYALDDDGNISKLDGAEDIDENLSVFELFEREEFGDDTLKRFTKPKKTFWYNGTSLMSPYASLSGGAIIFSVPSELAESEKEGLLNNVLYNVEDFAATGTSVLSDSYESYTVSFFDIDKNSHPAAIVLYSDSVGSGGPTVKLRTDSAIVEKVSSMLSEDGEELATITYLRSGYFGKTSIDSEAYQKLLSSGNIPKAGDIIRFVTNSKGLISDIKVDARYDEKSKKAVVNSSTDLTGGATGYAITTGKVFSHNSNTITLLPEYYNIISDHSDDIILGLLPMNIDQGVKISRYITSSGTVMHGSVDNIIDAISAGEDNASNIVTISYSNGISHIFIYE